MSETGPELMGKELDNAITQSKTDELIKDVEDEKRKASPVSRGELAELFKELRSENAALKAVLLKAKAQGRATIVEDVKADNANLKKLYPDLAQMGLL